MKCGNCNGTGKVIDRARQLPPAPCQKCGGTGKVKPANANGPGTGTGGGNGE